MVGKQGRLCFPRSHWLEFFIELLACSLLLSMYGIMSGAHVRPCKLASKMSDYKSTVYGTLSDDSGRAPKTERTTSLSYELLAMSWL